MGAVLSRYGVPVITMNTVDPPLQQVIRALGRTGAVTPLFGPWLG